VSAPVPKKAKLQVSALKKSNVFEDIIVMFVGQDQSLILDLSQKVAAMGGRTTTQWVPFGSNKNTHLVCSSVTEEFKHVQLLGGTIVTEDWILDCYEHQEKLAVPSYRFKGNPESITVAIAQSRPTKYVLPNVFSGICLNIHGSPKHADVLRRYIIAFEGDIENDPMKASVILSDEPWDDFLEKMLQAKKKIVSSAWAWDSINDKAIKDQVQYWRKKSKKGEERSDKMEEE